MAENVMAVLFLRAFYMAVNPDDVFVNCPFDAAYKPIFEAIVFTVARSGYRARCALAADDAADNRLAKICGIIAECKFGVNDISRTEADGDPPLPRFNMPLELGLFLGAKRFGGRDQRQKVCIVFDRERFRFQRYMSDIAGQDIHAHDGKVDVLIKELAGWLRNQPGGTAVGGDQALVDEYAVFTMALPQICAEQRILPNELRFPEFNEIVTRYMAS